ncbi:hypothetical protein FVE85_3551 [Porphyridium purpureum]|uniref:Uncharacterized protein n=1 Tax=Porphyridium purpureum TaxID=35688 RepID=A0A5J4YN69_PORPP|nr:hypothetical protein FVE85_3551 [Porphyridium purpureum]|eukprot:POR8664..scf249_10
MAFVATSVQAPVGSRLNYVEKLACTPRTRGCVPTQRGARLISAPRSVAMNAATGSAAPRGGIPGLWHRIHAKLGVFAWFVPLVVFAALFIGAFEYKQNELQKFKDTVAQLPATDHVSSIELLGLRDKYLRAPEFNTEVDNVEGKRASVAIYHALLSEFGVINARAAEKGLLLYGPFVEEARRKPGSHPNIDLLFRVLDEPQVVLVGQINTL